NRGNGLWGGGRDAGTRANGLWGTGGRGAKVAVLLGTLASVTVLSISPVAGADHGKAPQASGPIVPAALLNAAQANPQQDFHVIVSGPGRGHSQELAQQAATWAAQSESQLENAANSANTALQNAQSSANQAQANSAAQAAKA